MHDAHTATLEITIEALPLPTSMRAALMGGTIEHQRNAPSMALLRFHDADTAILDDSTLTPGNRLSVKAAGASDAPDQRPATTIFEGEIVAIEMGAAGGDMLTTCIRAYDKSHRLHRARQSRTFLNQRDGDIVKAVVGDHGLDARVDAGTTRRPWQCQHDQTDWDFILQLARENGCEVGMVDGTFRLAAEGTLVSGPPTSLAYGEGLHDLRLRLSAAEQSSTVSVRGWDPTKKEPVKNTSGNPRPESAPQGVDVKTVARKFTQRENLDIDHAVTDAAIAKRRADATRANELSTVVEAEGAALGNPLLRPGGRIKLEGIGDRLSGTYVLSSVRHEFGPDAFSTAFTITGCHDRSLLGVTRPGSLRRSGADVTAGAGPAVATVTNINDPNTQGRVKVRLGWLGDDVESDWAPVVAPGAGPTSGLQLLPEVDDQVIVTFAHGDVRRPMVLGGLWNTTAAMPSQDAVSSGSVVHRVWQSRSGHVLDFDDTSGSETVTITAKDGTSFTLGNGSQSQAKLTTGKATITLSPQGDVTIEAGKDLGLKAQGKVTIEGTAGVSVTSKATMEVAGTTTTVKGDAMTTLKGGVIQIN